MAARVGAAVRVGAAAKAPSWAPWHSSVEVAEVVRGSEMWERAKDNKDCCAVFPRSQYVARPCTLYGGVSSGTYASGPQGERFQVSLYEFVCHLSRLSAKTATHFGII